MRISPNNSKKLVTTNGQILSIEGGDRLWTVLDVARYLSLQPETVRLMARRGEIPARKIGRVWRFNPQVIFAKYNDNAQRFEQE